jgi:hypothetical protein
VFDPNSSRCLPGLARRSTDADRAGQFARKAGSGAPSFDIELAVSISNSQYGQLLAKRNITFKIEKRSTND